MTQINNVDIQELERQVAIAAKPFQALIGEMQRVIVGQHDLLEGLVIGLLGNGHILIEGVPGLAKTTAVSTLAKAIQTDFQRIQFTPDLLPADLIGTLIYRANTGDFVVKKGPIFSNIILADEINRAPAKVQSALLEAMQERQVTIGSETFPMADPFLVLATQNPIEQEGTYSLPEAQVDRFMLKLVVKYPSPKEERELTVMLAVDLSASQNFGTQGTLKREMVAEIAATLAFSAIRNGDKVGMLAFTDRIERFVPPRKGTRHVLRIVRELLALEAKGKGTRIAAAIDEVLGIVRKRSVLFVISDFQDVGWERSMAIARRRHDCIPVVISDRCEQSLPNVGLIEVEDPETGERFMMDTADRGVRARFANIAADERLQLQHTFMRLKMDPVEVETGSDFVKPLTEVFRRRESRRAR